MNSKYFHLMAFFKSSHSFVECHRVLLQQASQKTNPHLLGHSKLRKKKENRWNIEYLKPKKMHCTMEIFQH